MLILNDYRDKWFRIGSVLTGLIIVIYLNNLHKASLPVIIGQGLIYLKTIIIIGEGTRMLVYKGRSWFSRYRGGLMIFLTGLVSHYIDTGNWNIGNKTKVYIAISDKKFGISWWVKSLFLLHFPLYVWHL